MRNHKFTSGRVSIAIAVAAVLGFGAAGVAAPPAAPAPPSVNQMSADLRSGDAAKIAKVEAQLKSNVSGGIDYADWPLFDLMDGLGMAKDVGNV
jgi:hypothetical protein